MKRRSIAFVLFLFGITFFCTCTHRTVVGSSMAIRSTAIPITSQSWGEVNGQPVRLFTLTNRKGTELKITNYGGIVTSWITRDKNGNRSNIVVGFDSLENYLQRPPLFGAAVGRYANRIGNASFILDGVTYKLTANNGKNHIHGGEKGFDKVVWNAEPSTNGSASVTLFYLSKDGEEGYPGNLRTTIQYSLSDEDELRIVYKATTDKATHVNLTNHSYFNLSGDIGRSILDHTLWINADQYTPVNEGLIPTGEMATVTETPLDFRQPQKVGSRIQALKTGYDHNFVLNGTNKTLTLAAYLQDAYSGRKLEVYTTEPGIQLYTGNFLNGRFRNRDGKPVNSHHALCLETQHFPDSPNKPLFPTTILRPGETFYSATTYKVTR
jgi:aldose 1-epimerase